MDNLPILKFKPMLKSVVWGGDKLQKQLHKHAPVEALIGESWELGDLPEHNSEIADGPLKGETLAALVASHKDKLMGSAPLLRGHFPLLIKFIDAENTLSVQVHPDDNTCAELGGGACPKTEAWYIIDCEPGAVLYAGLAEGVTRDGFEAALEAGTVEQCLHKISVKPGDYVFLPSGAIHAIGAGIMLAEVQQSSNTTYRVFDWNRMGMDGKPRELHIEQALASIHFGQAGAPPISAPESGRLGVKCPYFRMETLRYGEGQVESFSSTGPIILMVATGEPGVEIQAADESCMVSHGETVLVPACRANNVQVKGMGRGELVITTIPAS